MKTESMTNVVNNDNASVTSTANVPFVGVIEVDMRKEDETDPGAEYRAMLKLYYKSIGVNND